MSRAAFLALLLLLACVPRAPVPSAVRVLELVSTEVSGRRGPSSMRQLLDDGATAAVVCLGEQHDEPLHHRLHAALLDAWSERAAARGATVGLGLEMLDRGLQPALDAFSAGQLDWYALLEHSDWRHRWGYEPAGYRPLFELARLRQVPLVALNAPRELTRRIAHVGIDGLSPAARAALPELVLDDAEHRRFFWAVMGLEEAPEHGGPPENLYQAQVVWDETMADQAARWIAAGPRRQMVIVAGNGHCHDSAIVRRVLRRLPGARGITVLTRLRGAELPPFGASDYVLTVDEERMVERKNDAPPIAIVL